MTKLSVVLCQCSKNHCHYSIGDLVLQLPHCNVISYNCKCFLQHHCMAVKSSSCSCCDAGCILTTLTLSQAVDPIKHYDDIVAAYEKLIREDRHRRGYYEDQKSKFTVQTAVYQFLKELVDGRKLDLSNKVMCQDCA